MTYHSMTTSWAHQLKAMERMHCKKAFALLMGMRTGKTKVILDDFGIMEHYKEVDDLLVIAPAGVYDVWVTEIGIHCSADLQRRLMVHLWSARDNGKEAKVRERSFMNERSRPRALIVDVEALSSVDRLRTLVVDYASQRRCYGVIDESTTIKNPESERSSFVINKLKRHLSIRRIASGLPTPRSPLDLFSQFEFLDNNILGHSTYATFKARYANESRVCLLPNKVLYARLKQKTGEQFMIDGVGMVAPSDLKREQVIVELLKRGSYVPTIPMINGYKNEAELWTKIEPHSFRVQMKDCYDVPAKLYSKRNVKLHDEQKRIYEEIKTFACAELESMDHVSAPQVITRMLRLHQVLCGHVRDEEGKLHEVPQYRVKELLAVLEEYDSKAAIWCSYHPDLERVSTTLRKEYGLTSVAQFWGGNRSSRSEDEKRFKTDPECRFMVATAGAGGRGRNWSCADLLVYYSNQDDLEKRMQSEERGDAKDKLTPMAVVDLVAPGTVDEKILESLRAKINMAGTITGDDWREWIV